MNGQPDIERALTTWFEDGPSEMPDRVVTVVADRIGRQRQRPAWRLPWRLPMNSFVKLAAALVAVIAVAVIGYSFLPRGSSGVGVPQATPSAAVSPSPTPAVSVAPSPTPCATTTPSCIGLLEPGTHTTSALLTPMRFTAPDGWAKALDVTGAVAIGPAEDVPILGNDTRFIGLWPDWNVADQETCGMVRLAKPGMGRTVDDLVTWLTEHPGLVTTAPTAVTVDGFDGRVLDVELKPGWADACGGTAAVFTHQGTIGDQGELDVRPNDRMRLYLIDVGGGHVMNIAIVVADKAGFDAFLAEATPVVESMTFE